MPPTAGSLTPTIILDLPGTFISRAPSRPDSKRFSQSTDDPMFSDWEKMVLALRTEFFVDYVASSTRADTPLTLRI